jgi:hypothetical protein
MAYLLYTQQTAGESSNGQYYVYSLAALLVLIIFKYVYQTLASPLRSVPGPILARFTRLWEIHAVCKHENAFHNIALHEKYGKTTSRPMLIAL